MGSGKCLRALTNFWNMIYGTQKKSIDNGRSGKAINYKFRSRLHGHWHICDEKSWYWLKLIWFVRGKKGCFKGSLGQDFRKWLRKGFWLVSVGLEWTLIAWKYFIGKFGEKCLGGPESIKAFRIEKAVKENWLEKGGWWTGVEKIEASGNKQVASINLGRCRSNIYSVARVNVFCWPSLSVAYLSTPLPPVSISTIWVHSVTQKFYHQCHWRHQKPHQIFIHLLLFSSFFFIFLFSFFRYQFEWLQSTESPEGSQI